MRHDSHADEQTESISAGDLAEMGLCEQKIRLRQSLGSRQVCRPREVARREGVVDHVAMHTAAKQESKSPCFIATSIYGIDAAETDFLRGFRDAHLMRHWWGKRLVIIYYRVSPFLVVIMERHPVARNYVKQQLDQMIRRLQKQRYVP